MRFVKCVCFFALIGAIGFLVGRLIPKQWMCPGSGIFRCFAFEKEGKLYEKLGVRKWNKQLPDMSKLLPFMMPPKNLKGDFQQRLPVMLQETCVAELIHGALNIVGLHCLKLWPGIGGVILYLLYAALCNMPYILLQRYNRPRLMKLQTKLQNKNA